MANIYWYDSDNMQPRILVEKEKYVVVDKPPGMASTQEGKIQDVDCVENWLKFKFAWTEKLTRGGVAHRLDKGTSGALLVAKSEEYLNYLKKQFKNRLVEKSYLALCGGITPKSGWIDAPLTRNTYSFGQFKVGIDGKEASTYFERLEVYRKEERDYSFLKIIPKTGRTHQIRAHLNYLGYRLVGDKTYGGQTDLLSRPFLHSFGIKWAGESGQMEEVVCPLENDLESVVKLLHVRTF